MPFTRPTHPVRRYVLSIILGGLFVIAFYFLWIKPQGQVQHVTANRTTQYIGLFHAWNRHDRWLMQPDSEQGQQIGLPTFTTGKGMKLTVALTLTLLFVECVIYHMATEPKTWRKLIEKRS